MGAALREPRSKSRLSALASHAVQNNSSYCPDSRSDFWPTLNFVPRRSQGLSAMSFGKEHFGSIGSLKLLSFGRNRWIAGVFACYVILVFVFAVVYHQIYQHDPRTFAFSSDLARVQLTAAGSETQQQLARLNSELASLRELQGELRSMQAAPT